MTDAEVFLDTNILVYALPHQPEEPAKQARAAQLIRTSDFGISFQVLQEVFVTITRKIKRTVSPKQALAFLEPFLSFPLVEGTSALFLEAAQLMERYQIHYYDAAIVAAARCLHAHTLYSEDLAHGQVYAGVRVMNPFLSAYAP